MKNKTARSALEAFDSILSEGIKPEKLRTYEGTEFLNESFQLYLNNKKTFNFMLKKQTKGKCSGVS